MNPASELEIVFEQEGASAAQLVRDRLDMFNVGATGVSAYYPVNFFVKSARGEVMGGLLGGIWGGWLHIAYLWIDEVERGRRWATRLMDEAEAYARTRGCHSVSSTPIPSSARPFYERRLQVFGTLDDYPRAKVLSQEEAVGLASSSFSFLSVSTGPASFGACSPACAAAKRGGRWAGWASRCRRRASAESICRAGA